MSFRATPVTPMRSRAPCVPAPHLTAPVPMRIITHMVTTEPPVGTSSGANLDRHRLAPPARNFR